MGAAECHLRVSCRRLVCLDWCRGNRLNLVWYTHTSDRRNVGHRCGLLLDEALFFSLHVQLRISIRVNIIRIIYDTTSYILGSMNLRGVNLNRALCLQPYSQGACVTRKLTEVLFDAKHIILVRLDFNFVTSFNELNDCINLNGSQLRLSQKVKYNKNQNSSNQKSNWA